MQRVESRIGCSGNKAARIKKDGVFMCCYVCVCVLIDGDYTRMIKGPMLKTRFVKILHNKRIIYRPCY